jgi:hypothetical protein
VAMSAARLFTRTGAGDRLLGYATRADALITDVVSPQPPQRFRAFGTLNTASCSVVSPKYPETPAKLDRDWEPLTAFYDFPLSTGGTCGLRIRSRAASRLSGYAPA